jgi:sterol carrier protein 2
VNPVERHVDVLNRIQGFGSGPLTAQMFGGAGREYQWKYGTKRETFAKISEKARKHASKNPYALFNQPLTVEEVLASMIKMVGFDMAAKAAKQLYERAGIGPEDVDVVELHDCFTANELLTYEAIGLCKEGEAEKFIWDGDNTYGGKFVTNPSGGLLSKGHPLGATGLAQCTELVWQLRGQAEQRQVEDARIALQHNLGLGGACVMTLYRRD